MLSGSLCVAGYNPQSGVRQWILDGPTEQFVASPVYDGKLLFITGGFPEFHILAIRPNGHGNVTKTHVAWHTTKGCALVPSPIIAGDGKYFLSSRTAGSPVVSRRPAENAIGWNASAHIIALRRQRPADWSISCPTAA